MGFAAAVTQTRVAKASSASMVLQRRNSEKMDIFLSLMAQTNSLPMQVTSTTLRPMLLADELVVSIKDDEENIQKANHTLAIVSELTSGQIGEIVSDEGDESTIVNITDDRYDASVDEP